MPDSLAPTTPRRHAPKLAEAAAAHWGVVEVGALQQLESRLHVDLQLSDVGDAGEGTL
jgi:hypothetical protein